jgi:hypothetical protein
MTEIKDGIFKTIRKFMYGSSMGLAVIYTIGHILIAMACIRFYYWSKYGFSCD